MKTFRSSFARPFSALFRGIIIITLILAGWLAFVSLKTKYYQPLEALRMPVFLAPAALVVLCGSLLTIGSFGRARGRYEAGAAELKIIHGWLWQEIETMPYAPITEVKLHRGPLMRLLGTTDLVVMLSDSPYKVTLFGIRDGEEAARFLIDRRDNLREAGLDGDLPVGMLSNGVAMERLTRAIERMQKNFTPS